MSEARTAAIIVAGGTGERLGRPGGKQLAEVLGRAVLAWTLSAFEATPEVDLVIVVCDAGRVDEYRSQAVEPSGLTKPVVFAPSGGSRQESVAGGIAVLPESVATVVVHDGARPLVTPELISATIAVLDDESTADGVVVGHPSVDTLKIVDGRTIAETPERARFWAVQTPQVFRAGALREAYAAAAAEGFSGTDDASLVERAGGRVLVAEGPRDNIKVTVAEDLMLVEAALRYREGGGAA